MKKTVFTGSGVALVTPMNSDGSVNYDTLGKILEYQIENGTDAVFTCVTTGESAVLDHTEHCDVISYTVEKVNGRVPVVAGTGSNDTRYAVELTKTAKELGVDAVLSVTPYYNKASQNGLIKHFTTIADSTDLPMILYNVPSRTGCNIQLSTYKELAKHENIVATKEASDNVGLAAQILAECGDDLAVYSGCDDLTVPLMSLGGKGVISVFANVMPKEMHEITTLMLEGKTAQAAKLHLKYLKLMNTLFCDVNPIPVKEAMNMIGFDCGECRLPLCSMTDEKKALLRSVLAECGMIK